MKKAPDETKNDELFSNHLKDQFVFFYALTNVAIQAYKYASKNYNRGITKETKPIFKK